MGLKVLQITEIVMLFWYWVFDSLIGEWKANANEEKKKQRFAYIYQAVPAAMSQEDWRKYENRA